MHYQTFSLAFTFFVVDYPPRPAESPLRLSPLGMAAGDFSKAETILPFEDRSKTVCWVKYFDRRNQSQFYSIYIFIHKMHSHLHTPYNASTLTRHPEK
jgi:hypothetical protein